jgi:xanthine dehydrogenase accessory factor
MNPQAWLDTAHALHQRQQPFAMVTVLRVTPPTSAKPGDKAVVTADGQIHGWIGGGCAQPAVVKTVRAALADGQARSIRISPAEESREQQLSDVLEFGMACHSGGTLELFIDPVLPLACLTVLGDSPVARALCDLAPRVGFAVSLVAQGAQAADFAAASRVLASDEASEVAQQLGAQAWVVVATQGRRDMQALKAALALQPRRTWFVASARKGAVLKDSLVAAGEDAARVQAIVAPAGLAGMGIGPQTPEEIALSVLAAVVAAKRADVNDTVPRALHDMASPAPSAPAAALTPAATRLATPATASALSCCGSAKKATTTAAAALAAAPQVAPPVAVAAPKSSCCGG